MQSIRYMWFNADELTRLQCYTSMVSTKWFSVRKLKRKWRKWKEEEQLDIEHFPIVLLYQPNTYFYPLNRSITES